MRRQHYRVFCAALLAVVFLMTAAGCAAEKPAGRAPEQVSAGRNAGPVRLSSGSLTGSAEGGDEGKTETGDTGPTGTGGTGATAPDEGGITDIGGDTSGIGDGDITGIGGDTVGTAGDDKTGPDDDGRTEPDDGDKTETGEEEPADAELIYDAGTRIELVKGKAIREGEEPVLTVALTGLEFADSLDADQFEWDGLPDGLEYAVERIDGTTAEITLSGTPNEAVEEVRLSLTIGGDQFRPRRDQDVPAAGSVAVTVAAGSGLPVSPVILAVCIAAAVVVLAAVIAAAVIVSRKKKGSRKRQDIPAAEISRTENIRREPERRDMANHQNAASQAPAAPRQSAQAGGQKPSGAVQIGKLHNIGRRSAQQDSMGSMNLADGSGVFAVVADGMGGLSGGDQVSQGVVMSMLQQAGSLGPGQMDGVLSAMVRGANEEINRQLGPDGIYRSGSTVVAALVRGGAFHWISVGDSRIYLYRGGSMLQLNQEHTYEVELMQRVMNGEITAAEAAGDPQRRGLTSFIGMGRLKYVDASRRPVLLQSGDRILLMTDGVFNNLPETAMADTLRRNPDVQQAARILEEQVLALQDPAQDNFTAVILGFQG